jgi:hypothetical protein
MLSRRIVACVPMMISTNIGWSRHVHLGSRASGHHRQQGHDTTACWHSLIKDLLFSPECTYHHQFYSYPYQWMRHRNTETSRLYRRHRAWQTWLDASGRHVLCSTSNLDREPGVDRLARVASALPAHQGSSPRTPLSAHVVSSIKQCQQVLVPVDLFFFRSNLVWRWRERPIPPSVSKGHHHLNTQPLRRASI